MAASKSASGKAAAKKASKTPKSRAAAKKASKTRTQRTAGKKAAATPKTRPAAKKGLSTRKTKAAGAIRAKTAAKINTRTSAISPAIAEINDRIAILRNNLRDLVEQGASYSGAANEELMSQRIAEQEAKLELLVKQREELSRLGS